MGGRQRISLRAFDEDVAAELERPEGAACLPETVRLVRRFVRDNPRSSMRALRAHCEGRADLETIRDAVRYLLAGGQIAITPANLYEPGPNMVPDAAPLAPGILG